MKCHLLILCLLAGALRAGEEQTEGTLNDLAGRVKKMLALQTGVNDRTRELHRIIQTDPSKQPKDEDHAVLRTLIARQKEVMDEADRTLSILEKEETAIAFVEVFRELRKDMECLLRRLKKGDVGPDTQAIERDVADALKEFLEALTKG